MIPFSDHLDLPDDLRESKRVITYGSTKLSRLAGQYGWSGDFFNNETFRVDVWNRQRSDMLNRPIATLKAKNVEMYFTEMAKVMPEREFFVRPMEDLKAFAGGVYRVIDMVDFMGGMTGNFSVDPETEVTVSETKEILCEWRYFVVGGKIIDGSIYRRAGRYGLTRRLVHEEDQDVLDEAQTFADKWLPSPCCVMDLALTPDGLRVVEFNTINSSGFYAHDIGKVVSALTDYVRNN